MPVSKQGNKFLKELNQNDNDIVYVLENFGKSYLDLRLSSEVLSISRTAITEGATSALGPLLYMHGPRYAWSRVEIYLTKLIASGKLKDCDPEIATSHLQGLLEAGILEPALYGAKPRYSTKRAVRLAIEVFLLAYQK